MSDQGFVRCAARGDAWRQGIRQQLPSQSAHDRYGPRLNRGASAGVEQNLLDRRATPGKRHLQQAESTDGSKDGLGFVAERGARDLGLRLRVRTVPDHVDDD